MITYQIVYRLFGIPVWSVTKVVDEQALYDKLADRFRDEMKQAFDAAKGSR